MIFEKKKASAIIIGLFVALIVDLTIFAWVLKSHGAVTNETAKLYFLNVGQGDSSLITMPGGTHILIDGGPDGNKLIANLEKVLPGSDRYIDLVVMTHPQLDHMGGFVELAKRYEIGAFIGNGRKATISGYLDLMKQLALHDIPYLQLIEGDVIKAGGAKLSVLGPSRQDLISGELNDTGEVLLLDAPGVRALYTADIDTHTENELMQKYNLDVDVLKVAHHGSRFSSGEAFLAATTPSVAAIEVGRNTYGHPTKEALSRLTKAGAKVTRADQDGIVKIIPTANTLQVFNLK